MDRPPKYVVILGGSQPRYFTTEPRLVTYKQGSRHAEWYEQTAGPGSCAFPTKRTAARGVLRVEDFRSTLDGKLCCVREIAEPEAAVVEALEVRIAELEAQLKVAIRERLEVYEWAAARGKVVLIPDSRKE